MGKNPYDINLGIIPENYIDSSQIQTIYSEFIDGSRRDCILWGPSGSGKTVAMTAICNKLKADKNWIVINLNPTGNLLDSLVSKLESKKNIFLKIVDSGILGVKVNYKDLELAGSLQLQKSLSDLETKLERTLSRLKRFNKHLLVCIDEVAQNENIVSFLNTYQMFVREDYPINILMAGLTYDIEHLDDGKYTSFVCRLHNEPISPLNTTKVAEDYQKNFSLSWSDAMDLASKTNGFPTAFQSLGSIMWEYKTTVLSDEMIKKYDDALFRHSYKNIIDKLEDRQRRDILAYLKEDELSLLLEDREYEMVLFNAGIVYPDDQGRRYEVRLPRFEEIFIKRCS